MDSNYESGLVLEELNFEYENSLAAETTSNSHIYLDIADGKELLKLWRANPSICNVNSPLAYNYFVNLIKRMLDIKDDFPHKPRGR